MNTFKELLADPEKALQLLAASEREPDNLPDGYVSSLVGDPNAIHWFRARRAVAFLVWEIYAAAAIRHYRAEHPDAGAPLMKANGAYVGQMVPELGERLEMEFLRCKQVPWRDERPEGYTYDPFENPWSLPEYRDKCTPHREVSGALMDVLNEILELLAPEIETVLGHRWSAGAARAYSQNSGEDGGIHTDGWPLGVRKLMIYPSGASLEQGSTAFFLPAGPTIVAGGKGVWTIFENSLLRHMAKAPPDGKPSRPTLEITILPASRTDPRIKGHGIHVGYPWLPPDIEELQGEDMPAGFTSAEIINRTLLRSLLLAVNMPATNEVPKEYIGLGYRDL